MWEMLNTGSTTIILKAPKDNIFYFKKNPIYSPFNVSVLKRSVRSLVNEDTAGRTLYCLTINI